MSGIEGMPLYLIMFDDTEVPVETMFGEEVARKRFEQVSQNWNAHLFVKVKSNSRDDMCAKSNHVCYAPGQQEAKGPLCFCGLVQTKNPHPEAGVPPGYLEVGTVYDCIPCLNKSRRAWSKRANKAEGDLMGLKVQLDERKSWMDRLVEYCTESGIPEDLLAEYKAISADKKTGD